MTIRPGSALWRAYRRSTPENYVRHDPPERVAGRETIPDPHLVELLTDARTDPNLRVFRLVALRHGSLPAGVSVRPGSAFPERDARLAGGSIAHLAAAAFFVYISDRGCRRNGIPVCR